MKIILEDENSEITITDEGFNVRGFVNIELGSKEIDVHLSEIYPLVKSFYDKYINELKEDKLK